MAQPAEIYVDPSIAGDSGDGSIGDPYGDLEYAIEQTTFDTTNGTRVNIKAGTDEVLAANIATAMADTGTSAAWNPTEAAPCIFQGYTSAAGDGGIGGISGGGSVTVYTSATLDNVYFIDLHCHNCGSAAVLDMDDDCGVIRCEVDNTSGPGILTDNNGTVVDCYVHNVGGIGIQVLLGTAWHNYCENGTNDFTIAIHVNGGGEANNNIISVDGTSGGIQLAENARCWNNSIYSNGGTGAGISPTANNAHIKHIVNNLVEGFSGTGGIGFDLDDSGTSVVIYAGNAAYNNATNYNNPADYYIDRLGTSDTNETLSASPFTDAANDDFTPVDTGSVKEGSLPETFGNGQHSGTMAFQRWKGAAEPAESTGGGGSLLGKLLG